MCCGNRLWAEKMLASHWKMFLHLLKDHKSDFRRQLFEIWEGEKRVGRDLFLMVLYYEKTSRSWEKDRDIKISKHLLQRHHSIDCLEAEIPSDSNRECVGWHFCIRAHCGPDRDHPHARIPLTEMWQQRSVWNWWLGRKIVWKNLSELHEKTSGTSWRQLKLPAAFAILL